MKRPVNVALFVLCFAVSAGLIVAMAGGRFLENGPLPPVPVPPDNPQTDAKVRLGAQLYFDGRLSADGTIICATCHDPKAARARSRNRRSARSTTRSRWGRRSRTWSAS